MSKNQGDKGDKGYEGSFGPPGEKGAFPDIISPEGCDQVEGDLQTVCIKFWNTIYEIVEDVIREQELAVKGEPGSDVSYLNILLAKTTAAQNEAALSYHKVRGLQFLAVFLGVTIVMYYCMYVNSANCLLRIAS